MTTQEKVFEIVQFVKMQTSKSGLSKCVIGLSGGIDSGVVLALAVMAIGKENVITYALPYFENGESIKLAQRATEYYKQQHHVLSIKNIVDAYGAVDVYRRGNIMARTRMTVLYDKAFEHNALVLNTCNLSEDLVGYATKHGDAAGDIAPIAHLTKGEVYALAEYLRVPPCIMSRVPSAELWDGQTDEEELHFSYAHLDAVIDFYRTSGSRLPLYKWMEEHDECYISIPSDIWDAILIRNKKSQHKLNPMPHISR